MTKVDMLILKNFSSGIHDKEIIHGIDLVIKPGEIHAIMGPNGSGKTTLAMSLMGNSLYKFDPVHCGTKFEINNVEMFSLTPEERARHGLFVSFQSPIEITGVSFLAFLRTAAKAIRPTENVPLSQFKEEVKKAIFDVGLEESFMQRSLNEGFSGGEKKRAEIAQMLLLKPKFAILDEIDSGLDIDSLRTVATTISQAVKKENIGVLLITHYQRILHYLKPDAVHILIDGRIKKSDGMRLVKKIEKDGYAAI